MGSSGDLSVAALVPALTAGMASVSTTPAGRECLNRTLIEPVGAADPAHASGASSPALVPIHSRSLHANNAVILRQAALCCLMIASAPESETRRGG